MPTYKVHEIREEVLVRKLYYNIEADCEEDAIEKVMNDESEAIEYGLIEPEYTVSGWSVRPTDAADKTAWDEALADLEARRLR